MLSEEEKKAIRNLENLSEYGLSTTLNQADLDKMKTVLNIITKLQKENEQKDKQIDLMAEYIDEIDVSEVICGEKIICDENCKDCIKQYFETKAKKGE